MPCLSRASDSPDPPRSRCLARGSVSRHRYRHARLPAWRASAGAIILVIATAMGVRARTGPGGAIALVAFATAFGVIWAARSNLVALLTRNAELTMALGFVLTLPCCSCTRRSSRCSSSRPGCSASPTPTRRLRDHHRPATAQLRQLHPQDVRTIIVRRDGRHPARRLGGTGRGHRAHPRPRHHLTRRP